MEDGGLSIKQYDESEPPYRLPDNMDVLSWSVPFLIEKVISMLAQIVSKVTTDEMMAEDNDGQEIELIQNQAIKEEK